MGYYPNWRQASIQMLTSIVQSTATHCGYYLPVMRNRIEELRKKRGISVDRLAEMAHTSRSKIYKLQKGEQQLTPVWQSRLAPLLEVAPADLIAGEDEISVPLTMTVASAFSEDRPDHFELPEPHRRLPPPRGLRDADTCFAVDVADDSAARLYPRGSTLFVRELAAAGDRLAIGAKVVVRHFTGAAAGGDTMELLVGLLDRTLTGDLVLLLRAASARLPSSIVIQHARMKAGFSERHALIQGTPGEKLDYRPNDDDPARILGVVVYAITPE